MTLPQFKKKKNFSLKKKRASRAFWSGVIWVQAEYAGTVQFRDEELKVRSESSTEVRLKSLDQ